ncbi:lysozyme inhibitor LprI family protein [Pseudomonas shahriarae]|jgi:uncharacterized protein YecT (DUF1311 family)|uniref:lysozyme inhibitor LprI family protein n=1 Tax=Pseudomonas shahriarae TaxID=2745512 RepID=UPI003A0FE99B
MRHHITVTALLITFLSPCALAKSEFSPAYSTCTSNSGGNTSELSDCGHTELTNQNTRLDKAYKSAMAALSTEKKRALQDAQVLWVKFRDADCGMYYSLTGGTMDLLEGVGCELSMTLERADSLEWFAKNGAEEVNEARETDAW